ncbi:carboxypeptidase B [Scaptodrosophila lebanonensis]|uniref:Carboxypeptidase B n=1 Tax=Drosophila lebanonensis TaxID=7225 RepID=A0A6J2TUR2_DROLE|nr:carboxypeptidase B [Scaptodrosophila lebanonensis]
MQLAQKFNIDLMGQRRFSNNESVRILMDPNKADAVLAQLEHHNLKHQVLVDDLAPLVKAQHEENLRSKARFQLPYIEAIGGFYTHAEINAYLDSLPERYPFRAFVKNFGRSFEGRTIKVLTITNGDGHPNKPIILIDAAMHAREWIAPSMALYIIEQLLDHYEDNHELLNEYDWFIIPVVNVDGYEYTHTAERYWRKTRRPTTDPECIGTDLNRNFGYEWGLDEGSSDDPCEDIYRGEYAFDQPEAQMLRDVMLHYSGRLTWYLSLHSYGNYILLPWGHTKELPEGYDDMFYVADAGAMAIVQATNGIYTYGSAYHVLYATSGDSTDYAVGVANVSAAMTLELPAGGFVGFDPWVSQIEGILTETWIGVHAMALEVIRRY